MSIFNNTSFKILQQGLDATWYKAKIIDQNIANISTPHYKAKTVEFKTIFTQKQDVMENGNKTKIKPTLDISTYVTTERLTNQRMDENNVDMEKEQISLADSQYQYSMLIDKVNKDFSNIRIALRKN